MLAAPLTALGLALGALTAGGPLPVDARAPSTAEAAPVPSAASGTFVAEVDFTTLDLRPVLGGCLLTVSGQLTFDEGTLRGAAPGTTTALVPAPCTEVLTTPPGTHPDVFWFRGDFSGTVDGSPASGGMTYAGITRTGGAIDAAIVLDGAPSAVLRARAQVAEGGSYTGIAST